MAAIIGTTTPSSNPSAAATADTTIPASSRLLPLRRRHPSTVSFPVSPKPKLRFVLKGFHSASRRINAIKAKLNEALEGSSDDPTIPIDEDNTSAPEIKNDKPIRDSSPALASKESINNFLAQVSSIVKLVDSRDIVELQLKQHDCELLIRKKEAIAQPAYSAPVFLQPSPPTAVGHVSPAAPPPPAPAVPSPPPSAATVTKPSKSSLPPFKCPMSGTFYRSPAPGEPPFVKVGDTVRKGQVLCIIEAMKLMNEIEADQSGTLVEILVEDGKPVGIDQPMFVIQP